MSSWEVVIMRTIALVNQKGGCGKTTLALHLAAAFWLAGEDVLLVDVDPQASATEWHDARENPMPHVEAVPPSRLPKVLAKAKELGAGIVIIDTAPHNEAAALEAARASDLVLVPCQPSIMDLRAMRKTVDLLKLVKVPAMAVLNNVPPYGTIADEAAETITDDLGLGVCPVRIGDRVAYSRCLITGQVAQEIEPKGKAAQEIEQLYMWTCKHLGMSTTAHSTIRTGAHDEPLPSRA
jgi:chromosome partitioning protein